MVNRPASRSSVSFGAAGNSREDQAHLDLSDPARPETPDLTQQAALVNLNDVPDCFWGIERRIIGACERVKGDKGKHRHQAVDRAPGRNRVRAAVTRVSLHPHLLPVRLAG